MKARFPILFKIALIGLLVTGLASGLILTVSAIRQNSDDEATLISDIDETLLNIEEEYEGRDTQEELQNALSVVKDYFNSQRHDIPQIDATSQEDYGSFKEYKQFIKGAFPWIYPDPEQSGVGLSLPMQVFRSNFRSISLMLKNACLTSGGNYAYMAYYDLDSGFEDLIFLNDSRLDESDPNDNFYRLPGSHAALNIPAPENGTGSFELDGKTTRYVLIGDGPSERQTNAYIFMEYDFAYVAERTRHFLWTNGIAIAIVLAGSVLIYMLLAYLFIIRNLKKLTQATNNISEDLKNKKPIETEKLVLKTTDELGLLASSFGLMQDEIVNYTAIIQQEAKENERRAAELEVASKIQLNALPSGSYFDEAVSLNAFIQPAKVVGGDFYDYFYNKGDFLFVIADVSGKGIPASLFMMKAKALIKSKILSGLTLVDAVKEANIELNENNTESLFVTAFIGAYDRQKGELRFVNAGHEKPYVLHNGKWQKLEGNSNYVLGVVDDVDFVEEKTPFCQGDAFFGFTDGLNESINQHKEQFGYGRIEAILSQCEEKPLEEMIALFREKHADHIQDEEPFDDVTMLAIKANDAKLCLSYDQKDYAIIVDATDKFYANYPYLDGQTKSYVGIVLDELLNNLVSYEKREDLKIGLQFLYRNGELHLTIVSNGADFNPFKDAPSKPADSEDKPGGHGINLVKCFTKKQQYEYKDGKSVITLVF